ncbi:hypothetical protein MNBD_GAMMA13-444 [hydrothermal vent metagenome]|uniref:Uncharacterized protein n=1 Tax=hydrothermal vent metagenome TaxID=652676 RepID=A0A3B0Y524_9ZZZZ
MWALHGFKLSLAGFLGAALLLGAVEFALASEGQLPQSSVAAPVVGGPLVVTSKGAGDVRWILPGKRRLDPKIFGTPAAPLGFEPDVGLPIDMRLVNADGSAWTTTALPTPFSDKFAPISGYYALKAVDVTLDDSPASKDKIEFSARFASPDNNNIYKVTSKHVIPVGLAHTFMGGVGTNFSFHGMTGIGTKLMPTMPVLMAFWGAAILQVNGVVVATNRLVHVMITCDARDADYKLVFDDAVDCSHVHTHVILANIAITPNGPVTSPVPTGFILPNGMEQPFLHIMYEDIKVNGG